MKSRKRKVYYCSIAILMLVVFGMLGVYVPANDVANIYAKDVKDGAEKQTEVSLLFTHDLHSHLDETVLSDGSKAGGFGKLKTFIDMAKEKNPRTFVVDGGDFSMGTLYQTIYETAAAELTLMGQMGYDATTIGNHEFDYRGEGFANMLNSAVQNTAKNPSDKLPALLSANIDWTKNTSGDNKKVKQAMDNYGSTPYTIIDRDGIKVGVFGVMGRDSEACAPESGIVFEDIIETSRDMVEKLEAEGADMIVCLSHSGTWEDLDKSEDELLAKAVPAIDVIVSGHTHSIIEEAIVYDDTHIVSAGCYGMNMGEIDLIQKADGRWQMKDVILHPMDDTIQSSEAVSMQLETYKKEVNERYLGNFGYTYDQVIADNPVPFNKIENILAAEGEDAFGNLLSDAYIAAVKLAEGDAYEEIDMAVVPSGVIRESLDIGEVTVAEAFTVSSLGIGADRIPGYPLVSVYLTGKEIRTAAEVDASISPLMDGTILFPSGMGWEYNPNRLFLNRVTDVWKIREDGSKEALSDNKLYRVVADLYSAQMLSAVESQSFGLLSVVPKYKNGKPIKNFEKSIIYNNKNGSEVKEWAALANYLESFKKVNGIPTVSEKYQELEGRKIITDSKRITDLIKQPNKIFYMVSGVILFVILLIIFVIFLIRRFIKKYKTKKI